MNVTYEQRHIYALLIDTGIGTFPAKPSLKGLAGNVPSLLSILSR
jgi:hypothetical protein